MIRPSPIERIECARRRRHERNDCDGYPACGYCCDDLAAAHDSGECAGYPECVYCKHQMDVVKQEAIGG